MQNNSEKQRNRTRVQKDERRKQLEYKIPNIEPLPSFAAISLSINL